MQNTTDYASIWSFITMILVISMLVGVFFTIPNAVDERIEAMNVPNGADIEAMINAAADRIEVPTADEIVSSIELPTTFLSLREQLKRDSLIVCDEEFDFDEIEDLYGSDDEVTLVKEYIDDRSFLSVDLGFDNQDDRRMIINYVYKVEVEPDLAEDYKDKVYVSCVVSSDDGLLEADLTYHK